LNQSIESLDHIDSAAARLGGPECLNDPAILAPIVPYVGEVLREATVGRWEVRPSLSPGGEDSLHPIIIGANGQQYPTFVIFKELLESGSIRDRIRRGSQECRKVDKIDFLPSGDMVMYVGWMEAVVPRNFVKQPSQDADAHVCISFATGTFRPVCVFMPGTS
jgi:hypothetical protein